VRRLSARVSDEAWNGWGRFSDANGVSFTAVIEAAGRILAGGAKVLEQNAVVELARKIDRERTRR
jgi:hypothetical protein